MWHRPADPAGLVDLLDRLGLDTKAAQEPGFEGVAGAPVPDEPVGEEPVRTSRRPTSPPRASPRPRSRPGPTRPRVGAGRALAAGHPDRPGAEQAAPGQCCRPRCCALTGDAVTGVQPGVTPRSTIAPVSDTPTDSRRTAAAARRRQREGEIIAATRALFDERGTSDAQIEDIARAVGVNRAIVYRHFTGKEELFALTLVSYLGELADQMRAAVGATPRRPRQAHRPGRGVRRLRHDPSRVRRLRADADAATRAASCWTRSARARSSGSAGRSRRAW